MHGILNLQNTKKAYPELVAHEFGTAVASHVSSQQAIQQISSQLTDFREVQMTYQLQIILW